jgi:hypothetical protein
MARRMFTVLSTLSLLLCAVTAVLWVRSYWFADELDVQLDRANVHFSSFLGRTRLSASFYDRSPKANGVAWSPADRETVGVWAKPRSLHVRIGGEQYLGLVWVRPLLRVEALHVIIIAVMVVLPAARLARWQSARRQHSAELLCRRCGYDLRATPGRCPECGTAAEGKAA